MSLALLERETYSEADAADLLGVPSRTLHRWIEGDEHRGKFHPPVLRPEPTGSRALTWGEFIEAALLCQYRRSLKVRLDEIRTFIMLLRDRDGVPYPLAHHKPWVGEGCRLLLEMQARAELPDELWLVAATSGQVVLLPPASSFVHRIDWDHNGSGKISDKIAVAWRPHADEASPVRCSPTHRFGHPAIKGISTAAIVEHLEGGEDETEVAEQFSLDVDDIRWASSYELSKRTPRAA